MWSSHGEKLCQLLAVLLVPFSVCVCIHVGFVVWGGLILFFLNILWCYFTSDGCCECSVPERAHHDLARLPPAYYAHTDLNFLTNFFLSCVAFIILSLSSFSFSFWGGMLHKRQGWKTHSSLKNEFFHSVPLFKLMEEISLKMKACKTSFSLYFSLKY